MLMYCPRQRAAGTIVLLQVTLLISFTPPCCLPAAIAMQQQVRRQCDAAAVPAAFIGAPESLQLLFECSGSERVDPGWVGSLYRPEVTAVKDNRVSSIPSWARRTATALLASCVATHL